MRDEAVRPAREAGLPLNLITFSDKAADNWHNILQVALNSGRIRTLLENICREYESEELRRAYQDYLTEEAAAGRAPAAAITTGLEALVALIKLPEVRDTLLVYRADLRTTSKQIDEMSNYKELHDLLHELQVHCYDPLVQATERSSADVVVWDDLLTHRFTLQGIAESLAELAGRDTFDPTQIAFIQEYLIQAADKLDESIETTDKEKLNKAISLIGRVLDMQPPRINLLLNRAARTLRLSELVTALGVVRDKVVALGIELEEAGQFIAGVVALAELNTAMTALIAEHDQWQLIDQDLRQIEPRLGLALDELELSWPRLKRASEMLYGVAAAPWARSFKIYTEKVDQSLAAKNHSEVRSSLRLYRRQAVDRFYRVDKNLKGLCEELRKVGSAPLDAAMNALNRATGVKL